MALGESTKQIAQQALLSATATPKDGPPAPGDSTAAVIMGQVAAMQKQLKEDEELLVTVQSGAERIRIVEIFAPAPQVMVLTGVDANRALTRIVTAPAALQLVCKT